MSETDKDVNEPVCKYCNLFIWHKFYKKIVKKTNAAIPHLIDIFEDNETARSELKDMLLRQKR